MDPSVFFIPLLFVAAFLYASVGHGGASAYLALLALFGYSSAIIRPSALLLNVFVSLISFSLYFRAGHFRWKLFLPFVITSVPAAFLGAFVSLDETLYKKILGLVLVLPVLRLLGVFGRENETRRALRWIPALAMGAVIGFISGVIGIGGGILLSPLILLLHWGGLKETAAVSALFIFVNSVAALAGMASQGAVIHEGVNTWLLVAVAGGFAGAYYGSAKFSLRRLKNILASVLLLASLKLITAEDQNTNADKTPGSLVVNSDMVKTNRTTHEN